MISVFLADDHELFRQGIRHLLEKDGRFEVLGEANESDGAIRQIIALKPDLALLDLGMPGMGGLEAARTIHSQVPDVKILIVSGQPEEIYAVRCLKAGASGFVHKRSAAKELIGAIEQIQTGGKYISPEVATSLVLSTTGEAVESPHARLSDRELEVMLRVASGLSSSQIAAELNLSIKTVSTYRSRISEKLELGSAAEIVRYALSHGLIE